MPDYRKLIKRRASARRVSRLKLKQRKAVNKITILLMLGLLVAGALFGARYFLVNFSGFNVTRVSVVNAKGEPLENPEGIFRLEDELNLFSLDMQRIAQDIKASRPQLQDVLIRKQFPGKLLIIVKERQPIAVIASRNSYLVDEEAFVLPFKSKYRDLPEIIGIRPRQIKIYTQTNSLRVSRALNLLTELKRANVYPAYRISRVNVRKYSDVTFYLEDDVEVKMGDGDFQRKAVLLNGILSQLKTEGSMPEYIDMRFDNPSVKP